MFGFEELWGFFKNMIVVIREINEKGGIDMSGVWVEKSFGEIKEGFGNENWGGEEFGGVYRYLGYLFDKEKCSEYEEGGLV